MRLEYDVSAANVTCMVYVKGVVPVVGAVHVNARPVRGQTSVALFAGDERVGNPGGDDPLVSVALSK
jgi:hypothetical protein